MTEKGWSQVFESIMTFTSNYNTYSDLSFSRLVIKFSSTMIIIIEMFVQEAKKKCCRDQKYSTYPNILLLVRGPRIFLISSQDYYLSPRLRSIRRHRFNGSILFGSVERWNLRKCAIQMFCRTKFPNRSLAFVKNLSQSQHKNSKLWPHPETL
jgi:hypothetical protein